MKKQLNTRAVLNELRGSSVFFPDVHSPEPSLALTPAVPAQQEFTTPATRNEPVFEPSLNVSTHRPTDPSIDMSTELSTRVSTDESTAPSTAHAVDADVILGRPKAFYLTAQQDRDLDRAVEKLAARLKGRANQKMDRSTFLRLLLDASDLTSEALIERLTRQFVNRLVDQLTRPSRL